jgi:phosphate transport system protein
MTDHAPQDETRQTFHEVLDTVRRDTIALGALVLENTERVAEALLENRVGLAQVVIDADDEIDERYVELEHRVFEILARQQPVAGDLRFLVSITRMLYEIERSGDLAVNCAEGLVHRDGYTMPAELHSVLARMTRASSDLFGRSLDALGEMDPTAGEWLDEEDDVVDDLVNDFYGVIAVVADDLELDLAIELSRIGRYFERIADHAVNIGEHITFIVTGEFPEADGGDDSDDA